MLELLNKYKKQIAYVIVGLFILYGIIWLVTREPKMSVDLKASIDSLTKANTLLIEKQNQLDSTIRVYESEVKAIDTKISNIKEKTTVIKEYYHEISQQTSHYNATQVDSFFKSKYGY
jgi:predicted nuclease with TOPRIM domain